MNEELNEKLAKWAGFVEYKDNYKGDRYTVGWEYPDDSKLGEIPDFTESLDACFKWLVPKLKERGYVLQLYVPHNCKAYDLFISKPLDPKWQITQWEDTPALALCKAIEQLIDKE